MGSRELNDKFIKAYRENTVEEGQCVMQKAGVCFWRDAIE